MRNLVIPEFRGTKRRLTMNSVNVSLGIVALRCIIAWIFCHSSLLRSLFLPQKRYLLFIVVVSALRL